MNRARSGWMVLALSFLFSPATALEVRITEAAFGPTGLSGISGEGTVGDVAFRFESCADGILQCDASIRTGDGAPLLRYLYEGPGGAPRWFMGGIDVAIPEALTAEQKSQAHAALTSPELGAAEGLWDPLRGMGYGPDRGAAGCLWRLSELWGSKPPVARSQ